MSRESSQPLIQKFFDSSLEDGDKEQLEALLLSSVEAREAFREIGRVHGLLRVSAEMDKGRSALNDDMIVSLLPDQPTTARAKSRSNSKRKWSIAGLAAAACIALLAIGALKQNTPSPFDSNPGLAQVASGGQVEWSADWQSPRGEFIDAGTYHLKFGQLRLLMNGGAHVSIAAPCRFEVQSGKQIKVDHGKLTARLPNKEDELIVLMPGLTLTDLGTGFGVEVERGGEALVSVFEGEVELKGEQEETPATILKAGRSIRHASREGSSIQPHKFDPTPFRDLWPLTLGIDDVSDLINFAPPGPADRTLFSYQDSERVFLLPEQQAITVDEPLLIDLSAADSTWPNSNELSTIPSGSRISSYLIFYNPPKGTKVPVRNLTGSVTFNREILGVICTSKPLSLSDKVVGIALRGNQLSANRQLESHDGGEGGIPHDTVTLSTDRRSIHFDFSAREGIDNIRILLSDD